VVTGPRPLVPNAQEAHALLIDMQTMKRFLAYVGQGLAILAVGLIVFLLWASRGRLSPDQRAQIRTYPGSPQSALPDTVTVMTYNIGYLSGMTNNKPVKRSDSLFAANMDQALSLIGASNPDVIAFQEIDYGRARVAHVHQLDTIATRLGYPVAAQAVNWDERYLPFPYGRPSVHFGSTLSGQSVLSRFPVHDHVRRVLPRPPQPFYRDAFYLDRLAQVVVVNLDGRAWALVNLHLEAFHTETREEQAIVVKRVYEQLRRANLPVLVLGDLNSTLTVDRDSATNAGGNDATMQTLLEDTDLQPVFADSSEQTGFEPPATFPADQPTRKIDYILYSPTDVRPVRRDIRCGRPSPPSDHCAVIADFRVLESLREGPGVDDVPALDSLLNQ